MVKFLHMCGLGGPCQPGGPKAACVKIQQYTLGRKGGSNTGNLADNLMEELNCEKVFTLPVLGGINESVVVTWIIMAVLVIASIILVRNLKVENPGKVQLALEAGIGAAEDFFVGVLGKENNAFLSD